MADVTANLFDAPWSRIPQQQPLNWLDLAIKQEELQQAGLKNAETLAQQRAFSQYGEAAAAGDQNALGKFMSSGAAQQAGIASQIPGHLAQGRQISQDLMAKAYAQTQQQAQTISDPEQQKAFINAKIMDLHNAQVINSEQAQRAIANMSNPAYRNSYITGGLSATDFMKDTGIAEYNKTQAALPAERTRKTWEPLLGPYPAYDENGKPVMRMYPPTRTPGSEPAPGPPGGAGYLPGTMGAPAGAIPGVAPDQSGAPAPSVRRVSTTSSSDASDSSVLPSNAYHARIDADEGYGQNPKSSAFGRGQFIKSTWLDQLSKTHPEFNDLPEAQRLAMRSDKALATEMIENYGKENAGVLAAAGLPVNASTIAMAHKLGPRGAIAALQADPNTPMSEVLGAKAAAVNPTWARQTAGGFVNSHNNKMGTGRPEFIPESAGGGTTRDPAAPPVGTANPADATPPGTPLPPPNADAPQARLATTPGPTGEPRSATGTASRAANAPPPATPERIVVPPPGEAAAPTGVPPVAPAAAPATPPVRPSPGVSAPRVGATPPVGTGQRRIDMAEGDSIGVGLVKFGGLQGKPVGGLNPDQVLSNIENNVVENPDYYKGRTVMLSTGTMNDPKNQYMHLVPQQIQTIKDGGGNVIVAGADQGKFMDRNAQLEQFANDAQVKFAGPLPTKTIHPGEQGYRQYLNNASKLVGGETSPSDQPQASQAQPAQSQLPVVKVADKGGADELYREGHNQFLDKNLPALKPDFDEQVSKLDPQQKQRLQTELNRIYGPGKFNIAEPMAERGPAAEPGPQEPKPAQVAGPKGTPGFPGIRDVPTWEDPRQEKRYEANIKESGEIRKSIDDSIPVAHDGLAHIRTFREKMKEAGTGPLAEANLTRLRAQITATKALGIDTPEDQRTAAALEAMKSAGSLLGFDLVKALGSREAVQVVTQVMSIKPNIGKTEEANRQALDMIEQSLQRIVDKHHFLTDYAAKNNNDYLKADQMFEQSHPWILYSSKASPLTIPKDTSRMIDGAVYTDKSSDKTGRANRYMWDGKSQHFVPWVSDTEK